MLIPFKGAARTTFAPPQPREAREESQCSKGPERHLTRETVRPTDGHRRDAVLERGAGAGIAVSAISVRAQRLWTS